MVTFYKIIVQVFFFVNKQTQRNISKDKYFKAD